MQAPAQQIPDLSFTYPVGNIYPPRPAGQGCTVCVHKRYCGAFYWHIRFIERTMPAQYGLACPKWSNDPKDTVNAHSEGDMYQVEKMGLDGVAAEPNQNGADDYSF